MMEVRVPSVEDVHTILKDVRFADMAEWFAGTGAMMSRAVDAAIRSSDLVLTLVEDGEPLLLWGSDKDGRLWMLATNRAVGRAVSIHRHMMPHLGELLERYGSVFCFADCRNEVHLKWLRWMGFEELATITLPPFDLPFTAFTKD